MPSQRPLANVAGTGFGEVLGILDMFSGGGLKAYAIFALGIMPYISASIILQFLSAIVPALQKVAKEGESGRRKITQWTRYAAVVLCLLQGLIICSTLQSYRPNGQPVVTDNSIGFLLFILRDFDIGHHISDVAGRAD